MISFANAVKLKNDALNTGKSYTLKTKLSIETQEGAQYGKISIARILPADATNKDAAGKPVTSREVMIYAAGADDILCFYLSCGRAHA